MDADDLAGPITGAMLSRVLGPIWDALERNAIASERIAAALERFEPAEEVKEPACPHPKDQRFALGTSETNWQCGACGHRELAPLKVD